MDNNQDDTIANFENRLELDKGALISITIVTLLISMFGKLITFGWTTIMFFWVFLINYILFTLCGIMFASAKNRTKTDYKYFFALCITLIVYSFTFRDFGDQYTVVTNKVISFINSNILPLISFISFCANIVLICIISKRCKMKLFKKLLIFAVIIFGCSITFSIISIIINIIVFG